MVKDDGIVAELLKYGREVVIYWLFEVLLRYGGRKWFQRTRKKYPF